MTARTLAPLLRWQLLGICEHRAPSSSPLSAGSPPMAPEAGPGNCHDVRPKKKANTRLTTKCSYMLQTLFLPIFWPPQFYRSVAITRGGVGDIGTSVGLGTRRRGTRKVCSAEWTYSYWGAFITRTVEPSHGPVSYRVLYFFYAVPRPHETAQNQQADY